MCKLLHAYSKGYFKGAMVKGEERSEVGDICFVLAAQVLWLLCCLVCQVWATDSPWMLLWVPGVPLSR